MTEKILLDSQPLALTINRLCRQLIENHGDFSRSVIIGVQPRGIPLLDRICDKLMQINPSLKYHAGKLDVSFYRDDFRRNDKILAVNESTINFSTEGKNIILIDDVMYTGRTVRAALDALLDYGRPQKVELMVLVERRFSRQLPIQPDYTGISVDSIQSQEVRVEWSAAGDMDRVLLIEKRKL